jgi:pimeloyl-[acyl-carrier protein] methyl ester esterase
MNICSLAFGAAVAALLIVPSWADTPPASAPPLFADSTATVNDRFSDEVVGTGPDLVFIPGLASSRETWKATAERLRLHYRLHLIQVAGFAGEPARANAGGEMLVPTAEAIDAYLVAQHLTPATIIGHSLGGTMALYLAEHHGDHLKKVMLVDSLPFLPVLIMGAGATVDTVKPMADGLRSRPMNASGAGYDKQIRALVSGDTNVALVEGWGGKSDGGVVGNAMADDMELDLRPDLAKITTPITLVFPDYAPAGSIPGATESLYRAQYAAAAPHVAFVQVMNSLHFVMLDQPAPFATALDDFLK